MTSRWLVSWTQTAGEYRPDTPDTGQWVDVTAQSVQHIVVAPDLFVIQAALSPEALATWRGDNRVVELTETLDAELETALEALYHVDVVALVADSNEPPADALIAVSRRPPWQAGITVEAGDVYRYERNLYEVVTGHTTTVEWPPDATPALWKRHYNTTGDNPDPFVQPTGAHDSYKIGDRVTFEGSIYESVIDNNVWSPTAYPAGWTLIGPA